MARSRQTANASKVVWRQHNFVDHAGKQATSIRKPTEDLHDSTEPKRIPFSFQIYSTLPLDSDLSQLVEYLGSEILCDGLSPSWEIYTPQHDVFSCVEHQRREIACRKEIYRRESSQAASAVLGSPSLPLIPKVVLNPYDHRRHGFLILITSDSYRGGVAPHNHIDPTGPLWVNFERKYPYITFVDTASRLEQESTEVWQYLHMPIEEIKVFPEKMEMLAERKQSTSVMLNTLRTMFGISFQADGRPDYGLDEDEGLPTDQVDITQESNLILQAKTLSLRDFQVAFGPGDAVTVTSSTITSDPDLCYIVYAQFLHFSTAGDNLESATRAFTSSIVSHLPNGKNSLFQILQAAGHNHFLDHNIPSGKNQYAIRVVSRRAS